MKVLFTGDLHGKRSLYEDMEDLAVKEGVECILLGGDILPTLIPSPIALINGRAGFQDDLKNQFRFVEEYLAVDFASFLESHPGMKTLYIPGNHDWIPALERIASALPRADNIHGKTVLLGGIVFFGYACVTDSTFWVKDYARRDYRSDSYVPSKFAIVSDTDRLRSSPDGEYAMKNPSIEEDLSNVSFDDPGRTICMFHCPPYGTGLDTLHTGRPIGSRAIRDFLARTQPVLSLHGHIHESPYLSGMYRTHIGKCLSVNPGQGPNLFHAVVFDTDDPENTMTHNLFGKAMPAEDMHKLMPERLMRKVKAFFMDTVLKG
ncbi:MAG TPA: metallophosphoesterase [Desulfomonilia bacterium]|nr:metallophosphoesterase [Desulfomonilia bacterium]